jgi:uncharacterized membrane protein YvlD (DUF360 family)
MIALAIAVALNSGLLFLITRFVPGVYYEGGVETLVVAGAVLSVTNLALRIVFRWIRIFEALFSNLFAYFILNTMLLLSTAHLVPSFHMVGLLPPLLGGVVFGLCNLGIALTLRRS